MSQATGKVTEEAESGENQAGCGVQARREFPGEDKRTWRGRKTGRIKPADPREASTGFGIGCHISGNVLRLKGSAPSEKDRTGQKKR